MTFFSMIFKKIYSIHIYIYIITINKIYFKTFLSIFFINFWLFFLFLTYSSFSCRFLLLCKFFVSYFFLCLTISYITIPADTDAFSEFIFPFIGIFTNPSQFFFTKSLIPKPSLPIIMADPSLKSWL